LLSWKKSFLERNTSRKELLTRRPKMAKKIFCITERSFHYVAAESKEDALKVLEKEDPLHTFDEGYGDVRMLSRSEAEGIGLGKFHEDDPLPEPEEDKRPSDDIRTDQKDDSHVQ